MPKQRSRVSMRTGGIGKGSLDLFVSPHVVDWIGASVGATEIAQPGTPDFTI